MPISSDDASGMIITAAEVTYTSDDHPQLIPMIEASAQNTGTYHAMTVADAGYHSGTNLADCASAGHRVLMPDTHNRTLFASANGFTTTTTRTPCRRRTSGRTWSWLRVLLEFLNRPTLTPPTPSAPDRGTRQAIVAALRDAPALEVLLSIGGVMAVAAR